MADPMATPSEHPPDEFLEFSRAAFEHRECRTKAEELLGGEVSAVPSSTTTVTCPHEITYWLVPVAWRKT
jgi:hypothetical protein